MWFENLYMTAISIISCFIPHPQIPPGSNITQCSELECPKYELTFFNQDYEIRRYEAGKWVGTSSIQPLLGPYEGAEMYQKLSDYISGENDKKQTIPITLPTVASLSQPINETSTNITLYFYLPKALHDDPPAPTNPAVHIQSDPVYTYYVRAFSGVADSSVFAENTEQLMRSIDDSSKYAPNMYIAIIYSTDYVPWHRRNEVWLLATS